MDINKIIANLGGPAQVAEICGVTRGAISHWKRRGMPRAWELHLSTKYPDAFKESEGIATHTTRKSGASG